MICHILSSRVESSEQVRFDSDESSLLVDKYANAHICSEEEMFTENIDPVIYNGVETVDRKDLITKGIGTVSWYWTDDEEQLHKIFNNLIYFPD